MSKAFVFVPVHYNYYQLKIDVLLIPRAPPTDSISKHFRFCSCQLQLLPTENVSLIPRALPID